MNGPTSHRPQTLRDAPAFTFLIPYLPSPAGQFTVVVVPTRDDWPIASEGPPLAWAAGLSTVSPPSACPSRVTPSGYRPTTESRPTIDWIPMRKRGSTASSCDTV